MKNFLSVFSKKQPEISKKQPEISKKKITVEQIHAEFDNAQDRVLQEFKQLLNNFEPPKELPIVRKAELMEKLGFKKSETLIEGKSIIRKQQVEIAKVNLNKKQLDSIGELMQKYPLDKFITVDELDRICNKYGLIYSHVKNYIKDVPEKNLMDMANCKPLDKQDSLGNIYTLNELKTDFLLKLFGKTEPIFYEHDLDLINGIYGSRYNRNPSKTILNIRFSINDESDWFIDACRDGIEGNNLISNDPHRDASYKSVKITDTSGFFVAAPKSHFDTESTTKKGFGFFDEFTYEVKDPVVFQYCKHNLVRIITKWGTDDDQSYLDPALLNEKLN